MSPRDRRALLLGGAVAISAVVALRVAPWTWQRAHETTDRLQANAELLARVRADVYGARTLEDSAAATRARLVALAPKILTGGTASEAFADLTGRLAAVGERARVHVERTDAAPDSAQGGALRRVTARAAIEGDTPGVLGFLGALAADGPVLTVDQVRIAASNPGSAPGAPEVLRAELTVRGWYLYREHRP